MALFFAVLAVLLCVFSDSLEMYCAVAMDACRLDPGCSESLLEVPNPALFNGARTPEEHKFLLRLSETAGGLEVVRDCLAVQGMQFTPRGTTPLGATAVNRSVREMTIDNHHFGRVVSFSPEAPLSSGQVEAFYTVAYDSGDVVERSESQLRSILVPGSHAVVVKGQLSRQYANILAVNAMHTNSALFHNVESHIIIKRLTNKTFDSMYNQFIKPRYRCVLMCRYMYMLSKVT